MRNGFYFRLLTRKRIADRACGQAFLDILTEEGATFLFPECYNLYEPVNKAWVGPGPFLDDWEKRGILWRRSHSPKLHGRGGTGQAHDSLYFIVQTNFQQSKLLPRVFLRLAAMLDADIGLLGFVSPKTVAQPVLSVLSTLTSFGLYKYGIPMVTWGLWLGPPYVELFGEETIESAPCKKDRFGSSFFLCLTEDIWDSKKDPDSTSKLGEAVAEHLGHEAFMGNDGTPGTLKPEFDFPENIIRRLKAY